MDATGDPILNGPIPKPAEHGVSPPDDVDPMAVWEYTPRIPRYD